MSGSVQVRCPDCGAEYMAAERLVGRRARCPQCNEMVEVVRTPEREAVVKESKSGRTGTGTISGFAPISLEELEKAAEGSDAPAPDPPAATEAPAQTVAKPRKVPGESAPRVPVKKQGPRPSRPPAQDSGDGFDDPANDTPVLLEIEEGPGDEDLHFGGKDRDESEMDMTPMVDVTFLLLIFFMVTAAFSLQKSIQVPKPEESDQPSTNTTQEEFEEDPEFVTVRVDQNNTFWVITPDWEEEAASKQEMLIQVRKAREGGSGGEIPTKLLVIAHGDAIHEKVVAALDAGAAVGMEEIQLTTTEEDFE